MTIRPPARDVCLTPRLRLRTLDGGDAAFLREQLTQPSWLDFIGDRGIRSEADALAYLDDKILPGYERQGFGMYRVELRDTREAVGVCGLFQRPWLAQPDLGFALLERHAGRGYAREAAAAVLAHARDALGLRTLYAITLPHNLRSARLLQALGFTLERAAHPVPDDDELLDVYRWNAP